MYAVCNQREESPAWRFGLLLKGSSYDTSEFVKFVSALVSGIADKSLEHYFCFSSGITHEETLGLRIKWPLCCVQCIMDRYQSINAAREIVDCIGSLKDRCKNNGDGMVWEQSTKIAILLRFVLSASSGYGIPFKLCEDNDAVGAEILVVPLGQGVKTVNQAQIFIHTFAQMCERNTLVLFTHTEASFAQFDGFCTRIKQRQLMNACGFQCKDNNDGASGTVPEWLPQGGHLLRSIAPNKSRIDGINSNRWFYYNSQQTDEFLGWSLRIVRVGGR